MSYDVLRACHVCDTFIVKGTPKSIFMVSYGIFHYKPSITIHFNGTRVPPWKPPHVWPSHDRFKTSVGQPTQSMLDRRAAASDTNSDTNSSDLSALSDTRHAGTTSALAPSMAAFYGGFVRWSDMKWYEVIWSDTSHMKHIISIWWSVRKCDARGLVSFMRSCWHPEINAVAVADQTQFSLVQNRPHFWHDDPTIWTKRGYCIHLRVRGPVHFKSFKSSALSKLSKLSIKPSSIRVPNQSTSTVTACDSQSPPQPNTITTSQVRCRKAAHKHRSRDVRWCSMIFVFLFAPDAHFARNARSGVAY